MKSFPIGVQSFQKIRKGGNFVYIDKTKHIIELIKQESGYFFLSRPRRFGKSLLLDTIRYLYEGKKDLFIGLFAEKNWDFTKKYPIIKISFGSGGLNLENLRSTISDILRHSLEDNFNDNQPKLTSDNNSGKFSDLIRLLYNHYKQKVVVLIDEYDKPILDNIHRLSEAEKIREELKNFYSVLKDSNEYLEFVFITGVSKFSKVSLFSGLNNLEDITLNPQFGDICGYTTEEIENNFEEHLKDVDREKMKLWYNGFNFLGENKVFNPFDILLFLKHKEYKNYWFETATPTFLINMLKEKQYYIPDIEHIQTTEEIVGSFDIENLKLETILFQTGYLTIKDTKIIGSKKNFVLTYPNLEIKMSLTDYILTDLVGDAQEKIKNQSSLFFCLKDGKVAEFEDVVRKILSSIPYDWHRKNNIAMYEGYYSSVIYCYFYGLGLDVIPEDTTNKGKIDITVHLDNYIYILEFKIGKSQKSALEQIKERKYWEKYLGEGKEIYLIGIEFDEEERNVTKYEWGKIN